MTLRLTDYLKSIGETIDPNAQYSISYWTVVPKQNARIENTATVTSDIIGDGQTDPGWFQYVAVSGWGEGEWEARDRTEITITKVWEGVDPAEAPAVTFELLANGEPALGMEQKVLADQVITLEPGTTTYTWTDLPTQHTKGEALMYSVREVEIEGFESTGNTSYFVHLDQPDEVGSITITNTAVPGDEPTDEPTEEPTEEPTDEPAEEPTDEPTDEPTTDPAPETTPTDTDTIVAEADAPKLPKTGAQSLALGAPAMLLLLAGGGLVARRNMVA